MARIRTIKPEFFQHDGLFDLESNARMPLRLAFAGLWTQCDREGRFKWRPRALKAQILPFDDVDFSRVLDALVRGGFVVKYEVSGEEFGYIPSWKRHQFINGKEQSSIIPAPPGNQRPDPSATGEEDTEGREASWVGQQESNSTGGAHYVCVELGLARTSIRWTIRDAIDAKLRTSQATVREIAESMVTAWKQYDASHPPGTPYTKSARTFFKEPTWESVNFADNAKTGIDLDTEHRRVEQLEKKLIQEGIERRAQAKGVSA